MSTPTLLSASECRSLLNAYAGEETARNLDIINVEMKPLEGPRAGFMSDHLRVKVSVRDEFGEQKCVGFFAKSIPQSVPIHKEYVESTKFYVKETAFYDTLLKDLRKAQKDGGHNRWIPECYFVRDDLIVLEDISLQGYKVFGHRDLMDLETAESVFAELARFHAASIILEESMEVKRPLNELYPGVLEERSGSTLRADGERGWFQASVRSTLRLVQHLPKYKNDPELLKSIREKLPEACAVANTIVLSSSKYRNVVSHGDIWASNVLVKRSAQGKPIGVRFVDLQLVRYSPPACDVVILLYIMTDQEFREKYRNHVFKHYYDEFARELSQHGLNPEKLFPFSEFLETCESYKPLGIIVTALCLQMVLLKPEFVDPLFKNPETFVNFMLMDRGEEIVTAFHSDQDYRLRLIEAVQEFVDTCIL